MLDPTMALVEISGKDCNCQKIQCPRTASEEKALMYYNKFTLPKVEGKSPLNLLWQTCVVWRQVCML